MEWIELHIIDVETGDPVLMTKVHFDVPVVEAVEQVRIIADKMLKPGYEASIMWGIESIEETEEIRYNIGSKPV